MQFVQYLRHFGASLGHSARTKLWSQSAPVVVVVACRLLLLRVDFICLRSLVISPSLYTVYVVASCQYLPTVHCRFACTVRNNRGNVGNIHNTVAYIGHWFRNEASDTKEKSIFPICPLILFDNVNKCFSMDAMGFRSLLFSARKTTYLYGLTSAFMMPI